LTRSKSAVAVPAVTGVSVGTDGFLGADGMEDDLSNKVESRTTSTRGKVS
jgi:hypothetical protein